MKTNADQKSGDHDAPVEGALARHFVALMKEDIAKRGAVEQILPTPSLAFFGLDEDDIDLGSTPAEPTTLTVELAASTILLASSLEGVPSLLKSMRREAPVVIVQAPDEATITEVDLAIRVCVVGRAVQIVPIGSLESDVATSTIFERKAAVILHLLDEKRTRETMRSRSMRALSLDLPVITLAVDVARTVPDPVRALSDGTLVLSGWSAISIGLLVEAVTGETVTVVPEPWVSGVTLDDLRASVSRNRGGKPSLERLKRTVTRRLHLSATAPLLEDLAGYGEAKEIGLGIVSDLQAYRDGRIGWAAVDPGLVLAGPPGTGKTLFAGALARSAGLPLIVGSLAEWQAAGTGHLGDLLQAMRKCFAAARAVAPAILFIDEVDSFGDRSSFKSDYKEYSIQVVNSLLEQLDGAAGRDGVVVIAASNDVARVDPAILRAGRLDRVVHISLPEPSDLAAILRTVLGADLADETLMPVALAGRGATGADAAAWVRRARGNARREDRALEVADLMEAATAKDPALTELDTWRVAVHESGHAVGVAALGIGTVESISIHSGGGTTSVQAVSGMTTRVEALAAIVNLLAGRAAEKLFIGSVSAGAGGSESSDLAYATRVAFKMEFSWGLGASGPVCLGDTDGILPSALLTFAMVPIQRILRHAEMEAERLVAFHKVAIDRLATRLRAAGYLNADDVIKALGPIPPFDLRLPPHFDGAISLVA